MKVAVVCLEPFLNANFEQCCFLANIKHFVVF